MTKYEVVIEFPAQRDLQGILRYITITLKEPTAARRIYTSIKEQLLALSQMPLQHSVVQDQPYAAAGVRKLQVENYIVFYIISILLMKQSAKSTFCVSLFLNRGKRKTQSLRK